jgi:hypothetical protein
MADPMPWSRSHRADPRAVRLADRHYSRVKPGTPQFVPPGRCLVLLTAPCDALWVSSWPYAAYVQRAYPGAWLCSCFRNEGPALSSALIRAAVAATRAHWGDPPAEGMVTMIDRARVRGKKHFGYCYRMAGFREAGWTQGGLLILQLLPQDMPPPCPAQHQQLPLFASVEVQHGQA